MSDSVPSSDRRTFLGTTAAAAAGLAMTNSLPHANANQEDTAAKESPRRIKLAVKYGMFRDSGTMTEKFKKLKEIGFDGVELNSPNGFDTEEVLKAQEESGLPVHGVVDSVHWRQTLSDPDPETRKKGLDGLMTALRDAKAYGADSVLLVPAVVGKTVPYHLAYERSQAEIRKALPLAEELGIKILLENVWNSFLLSPVETARYIDEFESDAIGAYFDVGNIVRYGWPEHWILALGKRIGKLDIKEYSRDKMNKTGPYSGFGVKLGEGSCDWPAVREALKEIDYTGWGTAEVSGGDADRMSDIKARMDRILF